MTGDDQISRNRFSFTMLFLVCVFFFVLNNARSCLECTNELCLSIHKIAYELSVIFLIDIQFSK